MDIKNVENGARMKKLQIIEVEYVIFEAVARLMMWHDPIRPLLPTVLASDDDMSRFGRPSYRYASRTKLDMPRDLDFLGLH